MKKIFVLAAIALPVVCASAQDNINPDTYIGAQLSTEDLNGTARYVGMGGAMEALGADLSVIGSNPAGIGLYRKSQVAGSFGLNTQVDGKSFAEGSKTNASFDQIGFVYSSPVGRTGFVNFAFNFHKSRNFDYVLSAAANAINGSSQNRQTYINLLNNIEGNPLKESLADCLNYSIMDLYDQTNNKYVETIYINSDGYRFDRAYTGYIGEYDVNLSGNINNRVYLGLTVGIKSVHYNGYSVYQEDLNNLTVPSDNYVEVRDNHKIKGYGYDIKLGAIFRPMEESPFRLGLYVHSPTMYKLETSNVSSIHDKQTMLAQVIGDPAKFRMNTPWKFGFSAGHTVGGALALGATYEYADYSTLDLRSITSSYYDEWDGYYRDESDTDPVMKAHTEKTLEGVHTLKLGSEYRIDKNVSVRVGYNYVSPIYKKEGVRDLTLDSPGTHIASTTDYTNWQDTHRLTAGVGFTFDQFRLDLAYQYQTRKGDFYPYQHRRTSGSSELLSGVETFSDGSKVTVTNEAAAVPVKDQRHQLLCTLTYTF